MLQTMAQVQSISSIQPALLEAAHMLTDTLYGNGVPFSDAIVAIKRHWLTLALKTAKMNQCKAADIIGIHRNTFSRWMRECRLTIRKNQVLSY
jgi:DNA-binding NtrC family response regulator